MNIFLLVLVLFCSSIGNCVLSIWYVCVSVCCWVVLNSGEGFRWGVDVLICVGVVMGMCVVVVGECCVGGWLRWLYSVWFWWLISVLLLCRCDRGILNSVL